MEAWPRWSFDLFEVRAGGDEEGGAGVAQVVEPQPGGEFGVLDGGAVVAGHERAVAEGSAFGGAKDVPVAAGGLGEVIGEHAGEEAGDRDAAVVAGLGGSFDEGAVDLAEAGDDGQGAVEEVE